MNTTERLVFGNQQHIDWVAAAKQWRQYFVHLQREAYRMSRRKWARPGKTCQICEQKIEQGQINVKIGRKDYHDHCLVKKLVECRKVCAALGFEVKK